LSEKGIRTESNAIESRRLKTVTIRLDNTVDSKIQTTETTRQFAMKLREESDREADEKTERRI
jgi:hypothetical protein